MATISPTQSQVQQALRAFLLNVLPATGSDGKPVTVVSGQQNRVPEQPNVDFVVMMPLSFGRITTNLDASEDVKFTGSISGTAMTVSAVAAGKIEIGATVFGVGVAPATIVVGMAPGTSGGIGTYYLSKPQTVGSTTLSAGQTAMTQEATVTAQLDFHGAGTEAGDMAQIVSTAFRDQYATAFFAALAAPLNQVSPLYADDPKQTPFINDQEQYEWRWTINAKLQVDQTVVVPTQFDDSAAVGVKNVSALYPP